MGNFDFTGFQFGNWKSYDENTGVAIVYRVSGGDRYDEQLHPEIKDKTAEVPGLNGEYYFGSDYGTRTFDIEIAFDSLTEYQFRELTKAFGTKDIKKLVFNERPYKYYMAKLESPIELSYVCFEEPGYTWEKVQTAVDTYMPGIKSDYYEHKVYNGTTQRIYKGEGKISLVAHFPFAKSNFKTLPVEGQNYYEGSESWALSSGLLSVETYESIDTYDNESSSITVYNPGDLEVGFRLYLPRAAAIRGTTLLYNNPTTSQTAALVLKPITFKASEAGVLIDTNSRLITGVPTAPVQNTSGDYTYSTNGILYNQYVNSGYFFKIEPTIDTNTTIQINSAGNKTGTLIFYDYLYF